MKLLYFSAIVTVVSAVSYPLEVCSNPEAKSSSAEYRLPVHAYPVHYDVALEANLTDFSFTGNVSIEIEITEEASNITLHAYKLTVTVEGINLSNATAEVVVERLHYNKKYQFLTIFFENKITVGSYILKISYKGTLGEYKMGFYRGKYQNSVGETKWFAATFFEPTYARYAFPCFDEPGFKAEFTISTIRNSTYSSISNMNLNYSTTLYNDKVRDTFQRSVKMSTYLVTLIVSDFGNVSRDNHSVFATKDMIEDGRGDYALGIGMDILNSLEEYTSAPYPIGKMYQVGLPKYGLLPYAMENWGIVTYREEYLLYKENVTTASEKEFITTIIAHEFAHQWFGNLVTPSWWIYIWLNEGFATYFQYYTASLVQPTWRLMDQMVIKSVYLALKRDSFGYTRPMTTDAGSPTEISSLFDYVVYDKAAAVIRMMEHVITSEVYKEGLRLYLSNRSYQISEPSHLWSSIQTVLDNSNSSGVLSSGTTLKDVMETWSLQSGYPIVTVERNYNDGSVTFSQKRYQIYFGPNDYNETYSIPINFATSDDLNFNNTQPTLWLTKSSLSYDNISLANTSWIIVNKQSTGYYRVKYDTTNWNLICNHLKKVNFKDIHLLNRAQLLNDAFNFVLSGNLSCISLLELLEYAEQETDYIPLYVLSEGIQSLDPIISGTDYYKKFQKFITTILATAFKKLGTDLKANEPITDVFNRINIIKWMCLYGGSNCRAVLTEKLSRKSFVHPDLQDPVYCGGMRAGSSENWDYLYQLYISDETEERQKSRLISAMGCTLNQTLLERLLKSSLGLEANYTLRSSDTTSAFSAVYNGSYIGVQTSFHFLLERFDVILERFSTSQVTTILSDISLRLSTSDQYQKLQKFIGSQRATINQTFSSAFSTALYNVNTNLERVKRSISGLSSYFEGFDGDTCITTTTTGATITSPSTTTTSTCTSTETTTTTDSCRIWSASAILTLLCLFTVLKT